MDIIFIVPSQLRFRAFPESGWGQGCSMSCPDPSHPIPSHPIRSVDVTCTSLQPTPRLSLCALYNALKVDYVHLILPTPSHIA